LLLECYKDTQVKALEITKLIAKLKNSDSIQCRNKICYFAACFGQL